MAKNSALNARAEGLATTARMGVANFCDAKIVFKVRAKTYFKIEAIRTHRPI